jgi:N-acetylneuraminate synthase
VKTIKTKVIAEVGNAHEGSIGIAFSMIDMAKVSGADLVKFQFHISEFESTAFEKFRTNNFKQDRTRQQYWNRVSFTLDQWKLIKNYCDVNGIEFLCSPFSYEAARLLFENNLVKRWKIGSGEVTNFQLLSYVFGTGLEVMISTGLANEIDLTKLIMFIKKNYKLNQVVLMHCVSQYPTPLKNSSLGLIKDYGKKYSVRVGHSDHSGSLSAPFLALTYGIEFLEIHITPHKLFFGPDTSSSLTPDEFLKVTNFRDDLYLMNQSKQSRDQLFEMSKKTAGIFRKSIYWSSSLKSGMKIEENSIVVRKPWAEIDASELESVIGKTLVRNVEAGLPVRKKDFLN